MRSHCIEKPRLEGLAPRTPTVGLKVERAGEATAAFTVKAPMTGPDRTRPITTPVLLVFAVVVSRAVPAGALMRLKATEMSGTGRLLASCTTKENWACS